MSAHTLTKREVAAVLAGLRYLQSCSTAIKPTWDELHTIATNGGEVERMDAGEIDVLCERLNFGDVLIDGENVHFTAGGKKAIAARVDWTLVEAASRVLELFDAQYLRRNADGGRCLHAMGQLKAAVAAAKGQP